MATGKFLLDTSVVVAFLRDIQPIRLRVRAAVGVCTSSIVLGELLYGAERSSRPEESLRDVDEFMADCPVLPCDERAAAIYAKVRARLSAKGKPLPENDIWIAATAMQHGLTLAGRDEHFTLIDGLSYERW